ncbi:hypothetical protein ABD73_08060 [Brevibacillus laterosporus]|nr:hypothetical protein [Brevibacillus laterosporus]
MPEYLFKHSLFDSLNERIKPKQHNIVKPIRRNSQERLIYNHAPINKAKTIVMKDTSFSFNREQMNNELGIKH